MNWKNVIMLLVLTSLTIASCNKDDEGSSGPDPLTVTSIEARGTSFQDGASVVSDLNAATSATNVAVDATITVTFDKAVDATSTATLSSDAGTVDATVAVSGTSMTITPSALLVRGTLYTLTLSGIKATDGAALASTTRSFTTEGRAPVVVPNASSMIAYWGFDGNAEDAVGAFDADNVVAIEYGEDRFGQGSSSATFDGDESIIEVPNGDQLMDADDFTLSFWVQTNTNGHVDANGNPASHFVMGLSAFFGFQFEIGADISFCKLATGYTHASGTAAEDLFFNGDGMDNTNGGWQGHPFRADLTGTGGVEGILKDKWAHVLFSHNATTKIGSFYLNGELMQVQDFNLWPDTDPKSTITGVSYNGTAPEVEPILAFGFIKSIDSELWASEPWGGYSFPTANHFKGMLDDVRLFKAPFSAADAKTLYDSEAP